MTRFYCVACAQKQGAVTGAYFSSESFHTASVHVSRSASCKTLHLGIGTVSMQQRATDQEAGGTGGAGPWPPQAPPSIAAVDPLSGDIPVNIPCTFPIGYPQNDTGQHSKCPYMVPMQGFQ